METTEDIIELAIKKCLHKEFLYLIDERTAIEIIEEYEMWAEQDGQTYSFYILFVKDADGIWRIQFF